MRFKRAGLLLFGCVFLVASISLAKIIVTDEESFELAAIEACEGKSVGIECSVEFEGGSFGFGVCVEIDVPGGGYLTCQIRPEDIDCKNNTFNSPGSWMTFGSLIGILFFFRRRLRK